MKFKKRTVQKLVSCCLGIILTLCSVLNSSLDRADARPSYTSQVCDASTPSQLPTKAFDWSKWNWSRFQPIAQGKFAGKTIDGIMTLGEQKNIFNPQNRTLSEITALAKQRNSNNLRLSDLGLLRWQSLNQLTKAIPGLGKRRIAEIPLVNELIGNRVNSLDRISRLDEVLSRNPNLAQLVPSNDLLSKYGLNGLPNVENTPLSNFKDWEKTTISQVPGLNRVSFPDMLANSSALPSMMPYAKMDIPLGGSSGSQEYDRCRTVTGSGPEGFNVPCHEECDHIELSDPVLGNQPVPIRYTGVHGRQFILGTKQWVQGGAGACQGREPTGRMLIPGLAKLVLTSIDERSGTAQFSLYFRFDCSTLLVPGHTPYILGPSPFMAYKEKDGVWIGFGFDDV